MAVIRWEPVGELNTIQNEMNRLFRTFFDQPEPATRGGGERRWIPAMDLVETGDHSHAKTVELVLDALKAHISRDLGNKET